ncbi:MAG: leucine-rich repeat protein [Bacteroides sp.]|nr:leucine-rich repeat protein [Bacteroides sp.]
MKKCAVFSLFLCLFLHCYGIKLGSLEYNIYGYDQFGFGLAEVSAGDTNISGNITIPGGVSANGVQFNVVRVADDGFKGCQQLTSITLPPTVTSIGKNAFYLCTSLIKVTFSSAHDSMVIGEQAFAQCRSLPSIELPNNTTIIDKYAFSQCSNLSKISLPTTLQSIKGYAFTGCNNLSQVMLSSIADWCSVNIENFEASPFSHNSNSQIIVDGWTIENLDIPTSVKKIGNYVFAGNALIKEIVLHKEIQSIGYGAFQYASNVKKIVSEALVPPTVGGYAFDGVNKGIPVHVAEESIADYQNSSEWKKFTNYIPIYTETSDRFIVDDVVYSTIGMPANTCAVIGSTSNSIVIHSRVEFDNINYYVKEIADKAFENTKLQSVVIEGTALTKIGRRAFANTEITEIKIPYGTEEIADEAFDNCLYLQGVDLPTGILNSIGNSAFNHCISLKSISLPKSLTFLGAEAFRECTNLADVTFSTGLSTIREKAFMGTKVNKLILPESVSTIGANAFLMCENLEKVLILSPNLYLMEGSFWWCSKLKEVCILANQLASIKTNKDPFNKKGIDIYVNNDLYDVLTNNDIWKSQNIIKREITFPYQKYQLTLDCVYGFGYEIHDSSMLSRKVSFSSSNPRIFTYTDSYDTGGSFNIPGNFIIGKNIGSATLLATASYGLTGECPVEVYNRLSDFTISSSGNGAICIGDTVVLKANPSPADALLIPTWTSENPSVIRVKTVIDNGLSVVLEAVGVGETTIIATDKNFNITHKYDISVVPRMETLNLEPRQWNCMRGDTIQLKAVITPENAMVESLKWYSNNEAVAIVNSEGVVTAINIGQSIITVSCGDLSATCVITVMPTTVSSISIDKNEWSAKVGDTVQLTATVMPEDATDKSVMWSSSDESVATVTNEGLVTAVGVGDAVIKVTSVDGSNVSALCNVTVRPILVESIEVSPDVWDGIEGETLHLDVVILPENATDKTVEYVSTDTSIAQVDQDGLVSVISVGNCKILVSTLDGSNLTAECIITSSAGIDEILVDGEATWTVYNVNGVLLKKNCDKNDLRQLTPGVYILQSGQNTIKIVIR